MQQPTLDLFRVPPRDPQREGPVIPIAGRTPRARHASWTGARSQVDCWTAKQSAFLQVLGNSGPLTRNELAGLLRWPVGSVCSILKSVRHRLESAGFEEVEWPDRRPTKRERFTIRRVRG